jgi:hypothetical protein
VRRVAPWCTALALGIALVVSAPAAAPAREQAAHVAGVTVSFGSGQVVHRTVTFSGDSITGLEALRGAGFDVEVYGFSGIGGAVCKIDGVGRSADSSCLNGGSDYWAYWHDGRYSSVGAGASAVHDRDQEQWAWGTGDQAPPTTAFAAPTTTAPMTTTTPAIAPHPPAAGGGGPTTSAGPGDPAHGSSTTAPGSSTTAARRGSTTTSTADEAGDAPDHAVAKGEEVAAKSVAHTSGSGSDGGGGGGPLAIAGFVIVLAAVVGLTLRARSARGNAAPRN